MTNALASGHVASHELAKKTKQDPKEELKRAKRIEKLQAEVKNAMRSKFTANLTKKKNGK